MPPDQHFRPVRDRPRRPGLSIPARIALGGFLCAVGGAGLLQFMIGLTGLTNGSAWMTGFAIIGGAMVLVSGSGLWRWIRTSGTNRRLHRDGVATLARIDAVRERSAGRERRVQLGSFTYRDGSGGRHAGGYSIDVSGMPEHLRPKAGDRVEIVFLPDNPATCVLAASLLADGELPGRSACPEAEEAS